MNKTIWISFDFGLKGDYQNLYTWLDNHNALECGQNLACLKYPYSKGISDGFSFFELLKKDITESIKLSKTDKLYVIYKDPDTSKMKGKWLNGTRKAASWEGYGKIDRGQIEDEGE